MPAYCQTANHGIQFSASRLTVPERIAFREAQHRRRIQVHGITLLEVLVVIGIIAIVAGIGFTSARLIARNAADRGAIATFQQSVWQGATSAAARGLVVELQRQGNELVLVEAASGRQLRTFDLPAGVIIPVDNPILTFLPPGKVSTESLEGLPADFQISTNAGSYSVEISVIGEVRAVANGG